MYGDNKIKDINLRTAYNSYINIVSYLQNNNKDYSYLFTTCLINLIHNIIPFIYILQLIYLMYDTQSTV